MPELLPGQTIETKEPVLLVEASRERPLRPGRMVFQLVVVDDSGNESAPVTREVYVIDDQHPTAVLVAPERVAAGQPIRLDGSQSTDIGGTIVRYKWTRLAG
jgi:hypothetical protein